MDYINIGAIGFAQFGSDDYFNKRQIEKEIMLEFMETDVFKIPEKFQGICHFDIKKFPYETGSYEEVVLHYNDGILDEWTEDYQNAYDELDIDDAESDEAYELLKNLPDNKSDEFWDFANQAEMIDFETDELMEKCRAAYALKFPMEVVHKKEKKQKSILKLG